MIIKVIIIKANKIIIKYFYFNLINKWILIKIGGLTFPSEDTIINVNLNII